jgi:hypothetical protein
MLVARGRCAAFGLPSRSADATFVPLLTLAQLVGDLSRASPGDGELAGCLDGLASSVVSDVVDEWCDNQFPDPCPKGPETPLICKIINALAGTPMGCIGGDAGDVVIVIFDQGRAGLSSRTAPAPLRQRVYQRFMPERAPVLVASPGVPGGVGLDGPGVGGALGSLPSESTICARSLWALPWSAWAKDRHRIHLCRPRFPGRGYSRRSGCPQWTLLKPGHDSESEKKG